MSPTKLASATSKCNPGLPIRKKKFGIICYWLVSFVKGWGSDTNTQKPHTVYFPMYLYILIKIDI